jgi:hypothetical protein
VKRLAAGAVVVLTAIAASACDSAHKLNGVYKTRVESEFQSGALNGVWRLALDHGAYTFNYTGNASKNVTPRARRP